MDRPKGLSRGKPDMLSKPYYKRIATNGGLPDAAKTVTKSNRMGSGLCDLTFGPRGVGFQNRTKIDKKTMQKSFKKKDTFKINFWSDFGRFLNENGGKLAPKSMKNRCKLRKAVF